jgi:hypothetical protein
VGAHGSDSPTPALSNTATRQNVESRFEHHGIMVAVFGDEANYGRPFQPSAGKSVTASKGAEKLALACSFDGSKAHELAAPYDK